MVDIHDVGDEAGVRGEREESDGITLFFVL